MDVENKESVYELIDSSDDSGPNLSITPSSFCNSRKSKYISPLERKQLKRTLVNSECDENKTPKKPKITKGLKSVKQNKKVTSKNKTLVKNSKVIPVKNLKRPTLTKQVLHNITNSSILSSGTEEQNTDEKYKNNKFFKHTPSRDVSFSIIFDSKSPIPKKKLPVKINSKKLSYNKITNVSCDKHELSVSEGYDSMQEESIRTMSEFSLDQIGSKDYSEKHTNDIIVENEALLPRISTSDMDASCSTANYSQDISDFPPPPSRIPATAKEILKDLEEIFDQIEIPEFDYSTQSNVTSEMQVLSENSQTTFSGKKRLYPIFYPQEKRPKTSPQNANKSKGGIVPKESFISETKQLMIDAGQKVIGAVECSSCGMVYHIGNEHDDALHSEHHEMFMACLKFPGWKKEHVLGYYHDGRIIMATKDDLNFKLKKIESVLNIVDKDLGFPNAGFPTRPNVKFLLFISNKMIVGCLVAESISYARRVELDCTANVSSCFPQNNEKKSERWCSSKKLVKAICGINRIWVSKEHRRKKIATRLLDCLRCNFLYGHTVSTKELAFSDPSVNGRDFAAAYTGTNNFLVYK